MILPYPGRFRAAMTAARIGKPFRWLVGVLPGGRRLSAMLDLAPWRLPGTSPTQRPGVFPAAGTRKGKVALLRGCAQSVLDPGINEAAIRLLNRAGVEVVLASGEGCCGALVHHMGRSEQAHALARTNIDAWMREMAGEGLDAIIVTTSGCGTSLKDYGFIFRNDPAYAEKAATVSRLSKDVSEYLETLNLGPPQVKAGLTVAYHAACSLQHGQQIKTTPKTLLAKAGFAVREPVEAHICCGSAGTYNMLQPEISKRLQERKAKNILATGADIIAAGNIGCLVQIGSAIDKPALHTIELLDWAYGGPKPAQLARLDNR
jgi:glycolate oxidase iron-sulfur subunit